MWHWVRVGACEQCCSVTRAVTTNPTSVTPETGLHEIARSRSADCRGGNRHCNLLYAILRLNGSATCGAEKGGHVGVRARASDRAGLPNAFKAIWNPKTCF